MGVFECTITVNRKNKVEINTGVITSKNSNDYKKFCLQKKSLNGYLNRLKRGKNNIMDGN